MKRIVIWAIVLYVMHVKGATLHVTGPEERNVEFGDGTTSFATLSAGKGFINATVTMNAPDFVTTTGTSLNEMMASIRAQQVALISQQADIQALKQFVGMMPSPPPPPPHPVMLTAKGSATDGVNGFTELAGAAGVATFTVGTKVYAIVASYNDHGVQLIDVSDPSNPVAMGSATDGVNGFTELDGATGVATFTVGANVYAIVAGRNDHGVQLMMLW